MKAQFQRSLVLSAALVGLLLTGPVAHATGIQCERAASEIEKAICADPVLLKLDQALGAQYDLAVATDPQVQARQINWLQNTLGQCQDKQCLVMAYKNQIEALGGNWEQIKQNVMASAGSDQQQKQAPSQVQPQAAAAPSRYEEENRKYELIQQRNQQEQLQREAQQKKDNNKYILIGLVVLVLAAVGWHLLIRNRCPHCKSTKYRRVSAEETDRWRGTKQVASGNGKNKTRTVQTTYVTMRFAYQCNACQGEWEKEREEEKGGGSWLGRLLAGY
ncbi:hypothetical protein Q9Q94_06280 [Uliginosibacterium sp. 31-16]|uniref:lysozyme inhibitor LprI family protein n=1 Tax=Uliginosibacterium sp. 31-16 TaxID=3068315 RepID=UPI00273F3261|nr:hypothetical protein [Uliginosibacterium sp. 31-16]MDP5239130.1 hypothetical protein [Uliginosibacterium sp. 31-16]